MRKRLLVVLAVPVLLAIIALVGIWFAHSNNPMLAGGGSGGYSVGKLHVDYTTFGMNQRIGLVIVTDGTGSSSEAESGLFIRSVAKGSLKWADGKQVDWRWDSPRDKGGDSQLDGTTYDLSNGAMFLVSSKAGQVRVKQLDVELSDFPTIRGSASELPMAAGAPRADKHPFREWAKKLPKVSEFLAAADGEK